MPCSKYSGRQRRACYATNEWQRPVRKSKATAKRKPKTAKRQRRK